MWNLWKTILHEHRLAALVACTALALTLLAGRFALSHHATYRFLAWNLVLAWVPYVIAVVASLARHRITRRVALGLLAPAWLAFFPNAPYLVTDFVHLRARTDAPLWYDIALLTAFAWTGFLLAVTSLRAVHRLLRAWWGARAAWSAVAIACPLTGAGIYIGRFLRWNSWDVALSPHTVVRDVARVYMDPVHHPGPWAFAAIFGALLFAVYAGFGPGAADRESPP